jgi:antitoxin (DNA-binding transcriptional repressor) of toxin-antitoxin stability system
MITITIQDILRDPLAVLRRVEAGETILVVRDNHPVAEIKPVRAASDQPRPFGLCAGAVSVPSDFDQPLPEDTLKDFEGR